MVVDPAVLAAQQAEAAAAAAAAAETTPPVTPATDAKPATKPALLADLEVALKDKAPEIYDHLVETRKESANYRHGKLQAEQRAQEAEAKLAEIEAATKEAARKELEAKGEFEKLYEQAKTEKDDLLRKAQVKLIETAIEKKALEEGVHPKLIKLITKHGVHVDEAGEVKGLDRAIERFRAEHEDLIALTIAPKTEPATQAAAAQADPPNIADTMKIPGSNMTYKQHRDALNGKPNVANAGASPTPGAATPAAKPDFAKMTPKEREAWYKTFKQGLGKK